MRIIKMTEEHAPGLAELDKICFSVPWSEKSFVEEAKNPLAKYFVAEDEGKIIGYCGVWCVQDEGQITNIAVLPEYRRKGIASKLLKCLLDECSGLFQVVLELCNIRYHFSFELQELP